ncbi:anthranilate phosphoribosyltransferase [Candidatus Nitrosacidococcus tergens]|uniref:Anthranilate phosphoribosyltransferase n=1 Tax=Candidatus Nitrosacidococcus tergens TaxID=553981 RepID=A0A7G1QAE4_9GAMM|nr:anthranilate phosphoribosyltransferase [Candidatus Nitrosacidococcus tergens]CAB1276639.1 Anthranilate phosphoribosyltransferase [Candidatus Nitrosacidococcus tergens]
MDIQSALKKIASGNHLSYEEMISAMNFIMSGQATQAQISALLTGLHMKGETIEEIAGAVTAIRRFSIPIQINSPYLIDTCGTGGDHANTFNISTAGIFVVAAAGAQVIKHGNRSSSSKCGSADVLEAMGVRIDLSPNEVISYIQRTGIGFIFAPLYHSAMKHCAAVRKEIGIRTLFNLIGPLINPANPPNQVIGVFNKKWLDIFTQVLKRLGSHHILIVHAEDGLDEISISAPTYVTELKNNTIRNYTITPEQFSFKRASIDKLTVQNTQESVAIIKSVLANQPSTARDIVALNAGAAIYAANLASSLKEGIEKALQIISSGKAQKKFDDFIKYTNDIYPR